MILAAFCFAAYWIGAIPFGVIIAKMNGKDIFAVGSGSTGATNINRALGLKWASVVFLLDVAKAYAPAFVATRYFHSSAEGFAVGTCAVVGHMLSPFIGFKGGKGIASGLGALLGSAPLVGISALSLFIVLVLVFRWISLGSVFAAASLCVFALLYHEPLPVVIMCAILGGYVVYRHRANLVRIAQGTEPKVSLRRSKKIPITPETPENA